MNFVSRVNVLFLRDSFKRGINLDFNRVRVQLGSYEKEFRITTALTFCLPPRGVAAGPGEAELAQGLR